MEFDQRYKDRFEHMERAPMWWFNRSRDLLMAAGAIWQTKHIGVPLAPQLGIISSPVQSREYDMTALMVFGMALECLMKGILCQQGEAFRKTHRLNCLVPKGVNLTNEERDILKYLSYCVVFSGRYPTSLDLTEFSKFKKLEEKIRYSYEDNDTSFNFSKREFKDLVSWESISGIYQKLEKTREKLEA